jgi:hypothetical protein
VQPCSAAETPPLHPRLPGDSVTQVVSNSDTYAHWSWQHQTAKGTAGNDCAYASNAYQYDYFIGDNSNTTQTGTQSFFQTVSADLKNGWTAASCTASYAGVCILDARTAFPCMPPPSPPPPPPQPPSPPSPPQPTSCAPFAAARCRTGHVAHLCHCFRRA